MADRFFGRERELDELGRLTRKRSASLVVVTGRRRIGKTALIEQFARRSSGYRHIAMAGLAVEFGVVMLVYLDHSLARLRRERETENHPLTVDEVREAVVDGALLRLRPKIMTVSTILVGLLPVMIGSGTGSEVMRRIAAPMVGGVVTSTVLTLVVLPAVYLLWKARRAHEAS